MSVRRARVSGAIVLDERKVMEKLYGEPVVAQALASMPEAQRRELEDALPVSWVSLEASDGMMIALASQLGRPPLEVHTEVVRKSVARTIHTLWRVLLHFTTDEALVRRTPLLYSKTCDLGELTSKIVAPGRAEIRLTGNPAATDLLLNGVVAGITAVLEYAGRKDVRVTYDRTPAGALFLASWRK
jgi:hypothetical protein